MTAICDLWMLCFFKARKCLPICPDRSPLGDLLAAPYKARLDEALKLRNVLLGGCGILAGHLILTDNVVVPRSVLELPEPALAGLDARVSVSSRADRRTAAAPSRR